MAAASSMKSNGTRSSISANGCLFRDHLGEELAVEEVGLSGFLAEQVAITPV